MTRPTSASPWTRLVSELRRLVGFVTAPREERAMHEEMRFHLDMHAAKLRQQGLSDAEARRRAAVAFGGASQWSEAARDQYRSRPLDETVRDLRFAVRSLGRAPAFTIAALLTLATGIGAAAAIFTVVVDVVVRPLPYGEPGRLVSVSHDIPGVSYYNAGITPGMYYTYGRLARSLSAIALYQIGSTNGADPDGSDPERLDDGVVTGNFMSLFRVPAALGRSLSDADDKPGAPQVVVISDALWHSRFGGAKTVIGKRFIAAGATREIVGVMPPSFRVPEAKTQLWVPLQLDPSAPWLGGFTSRAYARLAPGVTVTSALRDLTTTLPRTMELFPLVAPGLTEKMVFEQGKPVPIVTPLRDALVAQVAPTLWVVAAAAGLLLLVTCVNVANLLLVRAESRQRELAVRTALGAGRGRIVASFLIESLVLAGAGSALGLAAASAAVRLLVRASPIEIPRLGEVHVDVATVAFIVVTAVVIAIVCAAPPTMRALRALRGGGLAGLRDEGRGATAGATRVHARSVLVGVQMAFALVALTLAGLLVASLNRLRSVRPGFDPHGVATLWIAVSATRYPNQMDVDRFHSQLLMRVKALPGVTDAGITTTLPLGAHGRTVDPMYVEGARDVTKAIPPLQVYVAADAGYFRALRIPLIAGRSFGAIETQRWNEVIVSQETAKRMFGDSTGATVLGKRFQKLPNGEYYTVIGVAASMRDSSLTRPLTMEVYSPAVATGDSIEGLTSYNVALVVRTTGDVDEATREMRRVVHEIDPTLPTFGALTMTEIVSTSMAPLAFVVVVLSVAAGVTLLLGVVGLYGVIAYIVSLRTRELALRIALGATPSSVTAMVVKRGLVLSAVGAGVGVGIAVPASHFLRAFLFNVTPLDPGVLAVAVMTLAACAAAASWVPARRAARLDPASALRAE